LSDHFLPKNIFQTIAKRPEFSNHWKNIFQSLENLPLADGPADCAPPERRRAERGGGDLVGLVADRGDDPEAATEASNMP
jgi:hypothetical protein